MSEHSELLRSLTNITPGEDQIVRIEELRNYAKSYGEAILALTSPGRERALAKTKLEESLMWGVKAIAIEDNSPT